MSSPIYSKKFDLLFIIFPGFLACAFVLFANKFHLFPKSISTLWWLALVVFLDVGHVWSTIFRTYLHKNAALEFKKELTIIPLLAWAIGVVLYGLGSSVFWTSMAYLALFHFVKQQIGILKIYLRQKDGFWYRDFDILSLYVFILTPVFHWHLHSKDFNWFVANDFFSFNSIYTDGLENFLWIFYAIFFVVFIAKEIILRKSIHFYKLGHILSTSLVWLVGIVLYNNDWSFTLTNIVHHAVPYLGLIWISSFSGKYEASTSLVQRLLDKLKSKKNYFYLGLLIILGFTEEFLWDSFLWHEHEALFGKFFRLTLSESLLTLIIPILAVPQVTHYVLDGIIWRRERKVNGLLF